MIEMVPPPGPAGGSRRAASPATGWECPPSRRRELADWVRVCRSRLGDERRGLRVVVDPSLGNGPGLPLAYAEPDRVVLGGAVLSDRYWSGSGFGREVVAHELAHVAQYRLGGPAAAAGPLEEEAAAAGAAVAAGSRYRCRAANPAGTRQHWNRAGHYYTTLYLALAAGAADQPARRMALYCQVPDLVSEFDAITRCEEQALLLSAPPRPRATSRP